MIQQRQFLKLSAQVCSELQTYSPHNTAEHPGVYNMRRNILKRQKSNKNKVIKKFYNLFRVIPGRKVYHKSGNYWKQPRGRSLYQIKNEHDNKPAPAGCKQQFITFKKVSFRIAFHIKPVRMLS
jgi:hypothetical protein